MHARHWRGPQHRAPSRRTRVIGLWAAAVAVVCATALALTLAYSRQQGAAPSPLATPVSAAPTAPSPSPSPAADIHLSIGYGGDVLMHMPVMEDTAGGQGDIAPLIAGAQPWFSGADLALCGMEVPVAPDGVATGYPVFATLPGVVTALASTGWDGCATASNHAWDRGLDGVLTTADTLEANGLGFSGTSRDEQEAATPYQLYELTRQGRTVTIAQISTTYSLNGFVDHTGWAVATNDVAWVAEQARAARSAGADLVVLHSQLGPEYSVEPSAEQRQYAADIAATGEVDVLFGAHPHVPQPNELLPGGPGGRGMWVSYSAGNFISNQSAEQGTVMAGIGTFVWVDVTVSDSPDGTRAVSVDALHWHPFTVDLDGGHKVLDLAALARGEVPEGTTLSPEEIALRWETVTSSLPQETYSEAPPVPTGDPPVVLPRR